MGWIYLLWLREIRKHKSEQDTSEDKNNWIRMEFKFYLQLTLVVAAVSQAFPSAQLSPHVLAYRLVMQTITIPEFLSRLFGGVVGLIIASLWCRVRGEYRVKIQAKLDGKHDHHKLPGRQNAAMNLHYTLVPHADLGHASARMTPIRLSMQGGSYF